MGVAVSEWLRFGGIAAKEHKLTQGTTTDKRAELEMERKGAGGANVLHLALLVREQRQWVLGLGATPTLAVLPAGLSSTLFWQWDAQGAAQLPHLIDTGEVGLGQQSLDQRLQQC